MPLLHLCLVLLDKLTVKLLHNQGLHGPQLAVGNILSASLLQLLETVVQQLLVNVWLVLLQTIVETPSLALQFAMGEKQQPEKDKSNVGVIHFDIYLDIEFDC